MSLSKGEFLNNIKLFEPPQQSSMIEKASFIADFSKIPEEYSITKVFNIFNHSMIIVNHKASNQKIIFIDPNRTDELNKNDFRTKKIDATIDDWNEKTKYQFIHLENFEITKRANIKTMSQNVPYIMFSADTVNLPIGEVKGMLGCATAKNKKEILILSYNNGTKYSQIVSEALLNKVK